MKKLLFFLVLFTSISLSIIAFPSVPWGFYAHKVINRMAVFILPPEMMVFYKKHIDYLSDHAPDPDKRRYAVKGEAIKHYMDIDYWGKAPFAGLPRRWEDALAKFTEIRAIGSGDTLLIKTDTILYHGNDSIWLNDELVHSASFKDFIRHHIKPGFSYGAWTFPTDSINAWLDIHIDPLNFTEVICEEHFSEHGINPYHIKIQFDRLKNAFRRLDAKAILRLSADMGHYIADAHVPLHATSNYNGQLTGQEGIHAFWESRIPELFAEEEYEYFVGKAAYIKDVQAFAWKTIIESNRLSYIVLKTKARIDSTIPDDKQYGYEKRLNQTVRTQTAYYSDKYHEALEGMVEQRMQEAVHALGSLWMTAWIDAGQPVLGDSLSIHWTSEDLRKMEAFEQEYQQGSPIGRQCR